MKQVLALVAAAAMLAPSAAKAQGLRLIRDAEIESILRTYTAPVFRAAGISPDLIRVHIVNDPRINAFVAGGRHMFINTGLLRRASGPGQIIGVVAHETGHIINNHLIRMRAALREAQVRQIITFILAGAAGLAAGDARAAGAAISLGQRITAGTFFQYTQGMELEADRFALETLDNLRVSAKGLENLMEQMGHQEALLSSMQDPYLRTHPLAPQRLDYIRQHLARSPYTKRPISPRIVALHRRLQAKLRGFLLPPEQVHQTYAGKENTPEAQYARAVAYHRDAQLDKALPLIDGLIRRAPRDAYYNELKGQILLENGRAAQSVTSYRQAARLAPREPLIRAALGHALLQLNNRGADREALGHLVFATERDRNLTIGWRFLGVAYGRLGDIGRASLALAEYWLLIGNRGQVMRNVTRGEQRLPRGSAAWRRLQDIKLAVTPPGRRGRTERRGDPSNQRRGRQTR